ncbi:fungal-specific transcription factor domain-containing protein [Xylaria sp. CBS 124048]|nr:fungal-specific transcription factor domain-containing protein [Xylaria sp. CBS 124048]
MPDSSPAAPPMMDGSATDISSTVASSARSTPHPMVPPCYDHNPHPTPIPSNVPVSLPPLPSAPSTITGPITLDPFTIPSGTLNPRSCVTCRRRKVRCDKHMPCGNCRKAQIQCVFPAPGRAPRRPRARDPNAPPKHTSEREMELMKRLRKLEGIVEDLSGQIEFETYKHSAANSESPEAVSDMVHDIERRKMAASSPGESPSLANAPPGHHLRSRTSTGSSMTSTLANVKGYHVGDVNKDFGKLVLNKKGRVGYVSNAFWSKITDEIEALRSETEQLEDDSSDSSDDENSPVTADQHADDHTDHHGFIFGYSSSNVDLRRLHPLPSQMLFYWQVYMENVDPIVKLLHVPTMTKIIKDLRSDMSTITPGVEALMFAIYLAAIISLEAEEVMTNFGAEKTQLISRYRFATEQALARANCLTSSDLVVLQAFVLFLILVRRFDAKFSTMLTGLVVKIAQSLGLHRDGTHFDSLSVYEIEMRRRLWWAICVLDLRSAEDQGCELTVVEQSFDTRFPLHVNDEDITHDMTEFPPERTGSTDMTFCEIRYEICAFSRSLHSGANDPSGLRPKDSPMAVEEREERLLEMYEYIDKKYLRSCEAKETDLLHWTSALLARLIMSKMSLVIYQPLMPSTGTELPSDVRDRLFMASIEVVEYIRVLTLEPKIRRWRWLFQTYNQWHALAYLLLEVCRRSWSASVERGWVALNAAFRLDDQESSDRPVIWALLRKLMIQAKKHRDIELVRLRANPQAAEELDIEEHNKVPPASFHHLPSSVRSMLARDHWRKLVGTHYNRDQSSNTQTGIYNAIPETRTSAPQQQAIATTEEIKYNDLDLAMSETFFSPEHILPLVYPGDPTQFVNQNVSNGDVLAPPPPGYSKSTVGMGPFNTRGNPTTLSVTIADGLDIGAGVMSNGTNGMTNSLPPNDNPSWMWNTPVPNFTAGFNNGGTMGGEVQDINMDSDEVVNWQNWMDAGIGVTGIGFTGGI